MKKQLWWIGAAAACLTASTLLARPGVVKTRDGKTFEGDVEEKPDQITVNIRGIKTSVSRDDLAGDVEYYDNVEARYKDKVSKLPKNASAKDHLDLARWLFEVKAYDLSLGEIDQAKKIEPNNADAATLEQTVTSQRRIEKNKPNGGGNTATAAAGTGTTGNTSKPKDGEKAPSDKKFLSAEDINTIRQFEWKENDSTAPRVMIPADLRKRFVDYKALNPGEFQGYTGPQQAYMILRDGLPEMRKDVKISSDPELMSQFRRTIQPLLVNNCATVGCHGGNAGGKFFLYNNNTEKDEVAYTNFYILGATRQTFGDKEYLMIDRTYPEHSILAQFALPPEQAELKHPEIKGQTYKPIAGGKNAPAYKTLVNWMKDLTANEPNYGIKFDIPTSSKAKTPAKEPAKTPAAEQPKPGDPVKPQADKPATPR